MRCEITASRPGRCGSRRTLWIPWNRTRNKIQHLRIGCSLDQSGQNGNRRKSVFQEVEEGQDDLDGEIWFDIIPKRWLDQEVPYMSMYAKRAGSQKMFKYL